MNSGVRFAALAVAMALVPAGLLAQSVETYGTVQASYYVVDATQLSPVESANQYAEIGNLRYLTNTAGLGFVAPLHLPAGAQVIGLVVWGSDSSSSGEYQASLIVCDGAGEFCSYIPSISGCADAPVTVCSGNAFNGGLGYAIAGPFADAVVVDDQYSRYFIAAGNTTTDGTTSIGRIAVGYILQVSPAPSTASFTDVPVSDPAFQFVEAIAASGITAGCGGGNFCPDRPVTRRQMAVFLAKALGLQWN